MAGLKSMFCSAGQDKAVVAKTGLNQLGTSELRKCVQMRHALLSYRYKSNMYLGDTFLSLQNEIMVFFNCHTWQSCVV